jgi:hypothetical protein
MGTFPSHLLLILGCHLVNLENIRGRRRRVIFREHDWSGLTSRGLEARRVVAISCSLQDVGTILVKRDWLDIGLYRG